MPMQDIPDMTLFTVSDFALRIVYPSATPTSKRISPPRDDSSKTWWSDHQYEMPPVSDTVRQQSQEHVPHTPGQANDGASECAVLCIDPFNACVGTAR